MTEESEESATVKDVEPDFLKAGFITQPLAAWGHHMVCRGYDPSIFNVKSLFKEGQVNHNIKYRVIKTMTPLVVLPGWPWHISVTRKDATHPCSY